MEARDPLLADIAAKRIDDIRPLLDWEVWAPTRKNADGYTWYGIEEGDEKSLTTIAQIATITEMVQCEYTVLLPSGKPGNLFGVANSP